MNEIKQNQKVLLICGSSQTVLTFRLGLIRALQAEGLSVFVVALDDKFRDDIVSNGIEFYGLNTQNRSLNPFGMKKLQKQYLSLIRRLKPDIVFTFMLKPNIFGVRAAKKAGVGRIFSVVEGAGDVFINNGLKWKVIRAVVSKMYRKSFRCAEKVFFLNQDDKKEFIERKLVKSEPCEVIPGIGVDVEKFAYKPIKSRNTFLMVARMLTTKGVYEYCECARTVKSKYPDATFNYLGAEGTVKLADIQEYVDDGSINYLGTTKDVRPFYEDCFVYVLPSYREGMPMSIMEAEATGRAIIATDVNGCRDTVCVGENGFLIPRGDSMTMAEKAIWCIEHPEEVENLGKNARAFAEEKFDQKKINARVIEILAGGRAN